jgi:hypothetical protein
MKNYVKNATRHLVTKAFEAFAANKSEVSVLSLPGEVWEFENNVITQNDYVNNFGTKCDLDMILVESDNDIFEYNSPESIRCFNDNTDIPANYVQKRNNVKYINDVLGANHVKQLKSNNIFAWFDFCGNPTSHNIDLISTAEGKNVTYVFTFNTHWRCDTNVDPIVYNIAKEHNKAFAIYARILSLGIAHKLSVVWAFEYISNHNPMITICISNDPAVIGNNSLKKINISSDKKGSVSKSTAVRQYSTIKQKAVVVKRDLSAVYTDVKAGVDDTTIRTKHNITGGTLSSVKAWITMGK